MTDPLSQTRDPVELLAEEFLERRRRGEVPSLKEYADRYPHLADEIREVFPALAMMEEIDPRSAELASSLSGMSRLRDPSGLDRLGDFRILRVIGQGGMGVVYEAHQESLARHVALKVLPPAISRRSVFRERFQREARAAAQLHHTNIVPIFGVGEDRGILYYAMQFIQGQALDAVLEDVRQIRGLAKTSALAGLPTLTLHASQISQDLINGALQSVELVTGGENPTRLAEHLSMPTGAQSELGNQPEHRYYRSIAWLGVQAAEGLAHAHGQGILHRDIKPSNLLLDSKGTLWITDFGLAKSEGSADITQSGEFVGTLRYMAPERLRGRGDARSDVYSLGATLYEMLALSPPFSGGDRAGLIGQITNDTPAPLGRLAPLLPRDLETIVLKAMHREPSARYAGARDLAADLRCFLENRPIKARRSSAVERLRRWCRRNPAVAGLVGAVFFLLLCLSVGSLAAAFRLKAEKNAVAAAEADGAEKLYKSLFAQANASRFSRQVGQRFDALDAIGQARDLVRERHMPSERLDHLRKLAIASMLLSDFQRVRDLPVFNSAEEDWEIDDQNRLYVRWHVPGGIVSLRRLDTDEELAQLEGNSNVAEFSPGGRYLVCTGAGRFRVWDLSGSTPMLIQAGDEHGVAFHPDGRRLFVCEKDGVLWTRDLQNRTTKPALLATLPAPADALAFEANGNRLAAICAGRILILDASTGKRVATIPESESAFSLAWHPQGNFLAIVQAQTNPEIRIWDLQRMVRTATLKGAQGIRIKATFTPEGDHLLAGGWEGMLRLWNWRSERQVLQQPGKSRLKFGVDGRLAVMGLEGERGKLVEFASGREYRTVVQQSAVGKNISSWEAVFHPGGRMFVVSMSDAVRIFDVVSGGELASLPPSQYAVAILDDGTLLTNGTRGLLRWPIHEYAPGMWRVGPPKQLYAGSLLNLSSDRNGENIAQATGNGALLVQPGKGAVFLGPHAGAQHTATNADGRYVATGINDGEELVKIWDTRNERLAFSVPAGRFCSGRFSPDGGWLAVRGTAIGWKILKVGDWKTTCESPFNSCLSFSRDGTFFAEEATRGLIRLRETASGRELAQLEGPYQSSGVSTFSPDSSQLLVSSNNDKAIYVWDLRLLRNELAEMGLDWDAPPLPEAEKTATPPLKVEVELGQLFMDDRLAIGLSNLRLALNPIDWEAYIARGQAYARQKDLRKALSDYSMALALLPANHKRRGAMLFRRSNVYRALKDQHRAKVDLQLIADDNLLLPEALQFAAAVQCNDLAWEYATGPEGERDLKKALSLAQKSRKLNASSWEGLNTLGVIFYRLGDYGQATDLLEQSLGKGLSEGKAFDELFLAMCYARQANPNKAKDYFDRAVKSMQQNAKFIHAQPRWDKELEKFRAEAEAILKEQTKVR